jgi:hypothetical protein
VADAARTEVPFGTGMAQLRVDPMVPPRQTCGVARPAAAGERRVLRLEIDTRRLGDERGCPLTVDLYRYLRHSQVVIDAVVIYRADDSERRY